MTAAAPGARTLGPAAVLAALGLAAAGAPPATAADGGAGRPAFAPHRFDEDWLALCDPARREGPLDRLKCVPLGRGPGAPFLSLGGELRERYEVVDNPGFGLDSRDTRDVLLHRLLLHADLHAGPNLRAFAQLGSHLAPGRDGTRPSTDEDRLDLQQGFVDLSADLPAGARGTLRGGRQEISLGSSRLVSVRESANVRRSFDGARAFARRGGYRVDALWARPVALEQGAFDDNPDEGTSLWGLYGTGPAPLAPGLEVDLYYLGYHRDDGAFAQGTEDEVRHTAGARLSGARGPLDADLEAAYQAGSFGPDDVRAWTVSADAGVTLEGWPGSPRLGLKTDAASGDGDPGDGRLGTFNPLFPKLPYFTEANLVTPANILDLQPNVTLQFAGGVELTAGWNVLWRQNADDAFYAPPLEPAEGTMRNGGRYIGHQASLELTWEATERLTLNGSYVRFHAGNALERLGGRDGDFLAVWGSFKF